MSQKADFIPVLLGSDVNVYGMARSFHEAYGIPSVAIGKGRLTATSNSKIVTVEVVEPNLEDDKVFCDTLIEFSKRYPKDHPLLLVPCGDNYIKLLSRNQDALRPYYRFACIDEALLMRLSIKESFYQVCTEHGFSFPKTTTCTYENYKTVELPFGFPAIIKPSNSVAYWNCKFPHKKKVFVANNKEEFDAILDAIYGSSYKDHLILQEYIPGDDSQMRVLNAYCGRDKKVKLIALGHALLEEHSPEGIGSYAAIISDRDEELERRMIGFLEDIGYVGFGNFDIKLVALPAQVRVGTLEGQEQVSGLGSGPFQHGVGKAGGACQLLSQQGGGILEGGRIIDDAPGGVPEKVAGAAGPLLDVGNHVGGGVDRRFAVGSQYRENCGKEKEDAENFRQKKGELFHKMPSFPDDHRPYT